MHHEALKCAEKNVCLPHLYIYVTVTSNLSDPARAQKQLQQLESVYLFTHPDFATKRRPRISELFKKATSAGNILSDVPLPNVHLGWCMKLSDKKKLYDDMRMPVGGAVDPGSNEKLGKQRDDALMEPTCWHQMPEEVYQELFLSETNSQIIIDWCPMDVAPFLCMKKSLQYVGFCFSDFHRQELYGRLAALVFREMRAEGSPWYRSELAQVLKVQAAGTSVPVKPIPKPKAKNEAKGGTKRKNEDQEGEAEAETGGSGGGASDPAPKKTPKSKDSKANSDDLKKKIEALRAKKGE